MVSSKLASIAAVALFASAPSFALTITMPNGSECQLKDAGSGLPDCNQAIAQLVHPKPQPTKEVVNEQMCEAEATAYRFAVIYRDNGFPPQDAANRIKTSLMKGSAVLPDWGIKKAVNFVYFDSRFQGIPQAQMFSGVYQICTHPDMKFEPLK